MPNTAKLFMNGRREAIRLPSEFRFEGTEVNICRDPATGDVILSHRTGDWDEFFRLLDEVPQEEKDAFEIPRNSDPPEPRVPFFVTRYLLDTNIVSYLVKATFLHRTNGSALSLRSASPLRQSAQRR